MEITLKKAMELTGKPYDFKVIYKDNKQLYLFIWQLPLHLLDVKCDKVTYDNDCMVFVYHIDKNYNNFNNVI